MNYEEYGCLVNEWRFTRYDISQKQNNLQKALDALHYHERLVQEARASLRRARREEQEKWELVRAHRQVPLAAGEVSDTDHDGDNVISIKGET
jgi:hypothetical protein